MDGKKTIPKVLTLTSIDSVYFYDGVGVQVDKFEAIRLKKIVDDKGEVSTFFT